MRPSEALRQAAKDGVVQIRGALRNPAGGMCAFGVLFDYETTKNSKGILELYDEWQCKTNDSVVRMNDDQRLSFEEIAAILEKDGY